MNSRPKLKQVGYSDDHRPEACCGNCRFYEMMECRRHAPSVSNDHRAKWPHTNRNDWCGDHECFGGYSHVETPDDPATLSFADLAAAQLAVDHQYDDLRRSGVKGDVLRELAVLRTTLGRMMDAKEKS